MNISEEMKPIIFKDQLDLMPAEANQISLSLSLKDYKIDYNDYLGSGVFGSVYGVVERSKNDKNFFSYWFPYAYDYLFRPIPTNKQSTPWCIKISKSTFTLIYEQISQGNDLFLAPVIGSFHEKQIQLSSNDLKRKYRFTNIELPITDSYKAQIKTRIQGKTLQHYIENHSFINPNQYHLRKAYVDFLWKIKNVPLRFTDLHSENIMYDEQSQRIEIIDGSTSVVEKGNRERMPLLFVSGHNKTRKMLDNLERLAKENTSYTRELDAHLLMEIHKKPEAKEAHTSVIKNGSTFFSAKLRVNIWRQGGHIPITDTEVDETAKKTSVDISDDIITRHNRIF